MFNSSLDSDRHYESCTVIQPGTGTTGALLIGDFNSATDHEKILKHKIRTIITAASNM
jgi:hypothetical protein